MLLLSSWVENPKNRDHLRSRSVINEIETRSGVIESTFFFTPTSPNCYFSLHNQRADLNKHPVKDGLEYKALSLKNVAMQCFICFQVF
jgi:hypothetical protein